MSLFDTIALPPSVSGKTDAPARSVADLSVEDAFNAIRKIRLEVSRRRCRTLHNFVRDAWHLVEPDHTFVDNWHIRELCSVLEDVSAGKIKKLIVNVPPGTMKSLLVSVLWPAWEWTQRPQLRYLTASYSNYLTIRDNDRVRDIVQSEWYQERWPLRFSSDQNAKEKFDTVQGGWRVASSVGGKGTGEHPDRVIIDDPLSAKGALSKTLIDECNRWYSRTISTRGRSRKAAIVVVMQRLHQDDLTGYLLGKGGWTHVCWPMEYETSRKNDDTYTPDPRDPRTTVGELLWPALFPHDAVEKLKIDLETFGTAGQLQQNPVPEAGGLFKREWFVKFVDAVPQSPKKRTKRGWDTAGTELGGDWTVGVKMSEIDGIFYVEDVTRGQWGPDGVDAVIQQTAELDGRKVGIREEKEGGSAGGAVINARTRTLRGYDYEGVPVTGSKPVRSKPYRAQCAAGNVVLVRGPWNRAYIDELCNFPLGSHDDQVDGSSCAFNALIEDTPKTTKVTWGKKKP